MKTIITLTIISIFTEIVFSNDFDNMHTNGVAFGELIGAPTNSTSLIWTNPLFPESGIIYTNSYEIKMKESFYKNVIEFDVLQNNKYIAGGELFERDSFETARNAMFRQMVMMSLPYQVYAESCIVQTNNIGDFRIAWKLFGTNDIDPNPSGVDFVRGAKAIRLSRSYNDSHDIQPVAEMLDALLMSPP